MQGHDVTRLEAIFHVVEHFFQACGADYLHHQDADERRSGVLRVPVAAEGCAGTDAVNASLAGC